MYFLYNIAIYVYGALIALAAFLGVQKAKEWKKGRRLERKKWKSIDKNKKVFWFHCASLGEFDQGNVLMQKIKSKETNAFILLTFFSPSGMNHYSKREHCVDAAYYLPLDTLSNAKEFVSFFSPQVAFFVKYEFWANHIIHAKKSGVKIFCVAALFRRKQVFFKWYGGFFRQILNAFDFIYVQNKESKLLIESIGLKNVLIVGDTRYDSVYKNCLSMTESQKEENNTNGVFDKFLLGEKAIIIGSSWPKEESLIIPYIKNNSDKKFIIAPHDVSKKHIRNICDQLKDNVVKYTDFTEQKGKNCLLVDTIGHLTNAYFYGEMAFIGGGFSGSLHNILEPAVFGLPTFYGPNINKFPEAIEFINQGIGFIVTDQKSLEIVIDKIDANLNELTKQTKEVIKSKIGAAELTYSHCKGLIG